MPSFNSVTLLGNLTRDPEVRYTPQGKAVCDFALAVNRRFTRQDGQKVREVAFVDLTAWGRLAELSGEYLKKGRSVLVSGHLVQDRWEDPASGQKRSRLRVVADTLQFLGGSKDDRTEEPSEPGEASAVVDLSGEESPESPESGGTDGSPGGNSR
jgi:single-strand DNA-binding protein